MSIPIIDLFAGPGGLGEGFSSVVKPDGTPAFHIGLSIEKEASAFRTLTLRSVFRQLRAAGQLKSYYQFVRGEITEEEFYSMPAASAARVKALDEAKNYELGKTSNDVIDADIRRALGKERDWVLIGGPPCQAYSLAGRSRRANDKEFANDEKHFLYREYLRIIQQHRPAIFVMENVKGMISSTHSGSGMFERIRNDLARPLPGLEYEICSFVKPGTAADLEPTDYLVHAERFGIPQSRHRVILLGVRKGFAPIPSMPFLSEKRRVTVREAIGDLPPIRSRISRGSDSLDGWREVISDAAKEAKINGDLADKQVVRGMAVAAGAAIKFTSVGGAFMKPRPDLGVSTPPPEYLKWTRCRELDGFPQHESRSHMAEDLKRYLFAASFASSKQPNASPRLRDFPVSLLPEHRNARATWSKLDVKFQDRFRVQCADQPSSTIVSHIAKDGHYYIHYDPAQCRSLTVREAARLQTFPDSYFFLGNRTEQYVQVGNAVPPLLAYKLASSVWQMFQADYRRAIPPVQPRKKGLQMVLEESM